MYQHRRFSSEINLFRKIKDLDYILLSCIFLLGVISLTTMFSTDGGEILFHTRSHFFKFLFFSIMMFVVSFLNIRFWFYIGYLGYAIIAGMLIWTINFGVTASGSQRWIDLYFLPRFQPIEIVKPFLIILISLILSSEKYKNIYFKYLISFLITLMIALLLAAQPDIGQTLLVFFSWSVLIFISGINIIFLITSCLILSISLYFLIKFIPKFEYIKNRIF